MQFTIRELRGGWGRHTLAAIALGLFMAFLGPFGTLNALSVGPRTVFWLGLVCAGYVLALAAYRLIVGKPRKNVVRAIAVAALSALPQTFIVSWALVQIQPGRVISIGNLPMLYLAVVSVQAIIVAVQTWLSSGPDSAAAPLATAGGTIQQARGRITQSLLRDLIALEAEDHYVRVHHPSGSTLILHRFSDAIAELDSRDGLQVHRGWWVASGAVAGTFLRNDRRWLKLSNGLEIPVSRTHLRRVIEQNWPRIAASEAKNA